MEHHPSTTIASRYSQMAIATYRGVLVATLLDLAVGNTSRSLFANIIPASWQTITFISILFLLSGWTWGESHLPKRYHRLPFSQQAMLHLAFQLLLTLLGVFLGNIPYSLFLLFPPILFCAINFGQKTNLYLAILLLAVGIIRVSLDPDYTLLTPTGVNDVVIFGFGLLFTWGLARSLAQETAVRHQTEKLQKNVANANRQLQLYAEQAAKNEPFSLETAVFSLIHRLGELPVRFSLSGNEYEYSQLVRLTMLCVVQEGLTNIYKHADATQANLTITFVSDQANIVLHDNGRGMETGRLRALSTHSRGQFGLLAVRERLSSVGG
ncbi:MAG: hypothetical protein AAF614_39575, partial [Chloroflexota bacterium]